MKEIWKDIKDYKGLYKVSNKGRVKSLNYNKTKKHKILKPNLNTSGYKKLTLFAKGKNNKTLYIHRLVALTFIKNPLNKRTVNHKNGIKTDNNITNLEWNSYSENMKHSFDFIGRKAANGNKKPNAKLNELKVLEIRKKYKTKKYTHEDLSKEFNISSTTIHCVLNNKAWKHVF